MTSRFVVFDGGDGAGKTTQATRLVQTLRAAGRTVVHTREPGGTTLGENLRNLLLLGEDIPPRAEALLFLAGRAAHVDQVIRPALAHGDVVVCERFTDSSCVYQGFARGLGMHRIRQLSQWATDSLEPDLVVVLDIDPRAARARGNKEPDRIEREDLEFHDLVRQAFLDLAMEGIRRRRESPGYPRYLALDATAQAGAIASAVLAAFTDIADEPALVHVAETGAAR